MTKRIRFPIRFKFMLTLLVIVTAMMSLVTFSTANMFQKDKQAYVNGLTSLVAVGAAEETRSLLIGYRDRLQVYARIMTESELTEADKAELSRTFFGDFPQLIGVVLQWSDGESGGVYNIEALEEAGLSKDDVIEFEQRHPLPIESIVEGSSFIRNSTLAKELPCFTLAFAQEVQDDPEPMVVSAIIRLDDFLALTSRFTGYDMFLADSQGTLLAHRDVRRVAAREVAELQPEVLQVQGAYHAGLTLEFEIDGVEMIGGFATVDFAGVTLAAQIPRSSAYLSSRRLVGQQLSIASVLLLCAILIGFVWASRVTGPVERLSAATRRIGKGEFDIEVSSDTADEIGELAGSFNQMTSELRDREKALDEAQVQLIQSEKMAAFGQLGAGIAHEVKNPLAGILACAQVTLMEVDRDSQVGQDLQLIEKETKRCKTIIDNLMRFARQEKAVMEPVDINAVVLDAVAIINHQLELSQVRLERELAPDLPPIHGNANQLQQVFMNLMLNAQQSLEDNPGRIRIATGLGASGEIEARVSDDGPGMSDEVRERLFEPFFTTKPGGKGTGLGLSVSFGIVSDHDGSIAVESEPGQGATFIITLPALQPALQPESAGRQLVGDRV